ncbi:hypothetical protein [Acinetobacter bereziniae]|uniref:hypothetical protein n=1 Tax=Acinetobacter bereziniae TaxID=106648 RepID=UPI00069457BB|nr:hypothetical protein [Acinetobacter bereziniae]
MTENINDLTGDIRCIAEIIGKQQALFLVSQYPRYKSKKRNGEGQLLLYVPKANHLGLDHRLVAILGYVDAYKLCSEFGGELLTLSFCKHIILKKRNAGIIDMLKQGYSSEQLAEFFNLSTRAVLLVAAGK